MPDAAPPQIPPGKFKAVAEAIGDSFNFEQLNILIYKCFGTRRINDWASEKQPSRAVAALCLEGVEREGLQLIFVANVLACIPSDKPEYGIIKDALPEATQALSSVKSEIPDLVRGLQSTRQSLQDPHGKQALSTSRASFEKLNDGITDLQVYKALHDCLHGIQIKQLATLASAVRRIASKDPDVIVGLREYGQMLQTAAVSARDIVDAIPEADPRKGIELRWIKALEEATRFYQTGLSREDPTAARIGVIKLTAVLRAESPRLNDLIVEKARDLPLGQLRTALASVAAATPQQPDVPRAVGAIDAIEVALRGEIAEHDSWQNVDRGIWVLDELFGEAGVPLDVFLGLWPDVRNPTRALADLSSGSDWAKALIDQLNRVDEDLLRLDSTQGAAGSQQQNLSAAFSVFRGEARLRFFAVDQRLKQDCAQLVKIGQPIRDILEGLDK